MPQKCTPYLCMYAMYVCVCIFWSYRMHTNAKTIFQLIYKKRSLNSCRLILALSTPRSRIISSFVHPHKNYYNKEMQLTAGGVSALQFRLVLASLLLSYWTTVPVVLSQSSEEAGNPRNSDESYCSRTSDPDLSQKLRLEAIKHEILLRLGLDEAPPNPDPNVELPTSDPMFMENYRAAQEVQKAHNANQKPCTKIDTKEKRLLAFFPTDVKGHQPIVHPTMIQQDKNAKSLDTG